MRQLLIVLAMCIGVFVSRPANAQLVDTENPCYKTMFGNVPKSNILTTGSWENEQQVRQAAEAIRFAVGMMLLARRAPRKG